MPNIGVSCKFKLHYTVTNTIYCDILSLKTLQISSVLMFHGVHASTI